MGDFKRTRKLRHLSQRTGCDCVIASAAIVANCSYRAAAELSIVEPGVRPLYPREIRALLHRTTQVRWLGPIMPFSRQIHSFCKAKRIYVILIRQKCASLGRPQKEQTNHAVVVCDGMIYDPETRAPTPVADYSRSDWNAVGYYFPVNVRKLTAVQNKNNENLIESRLWEEVFDR